MPTNYAGETYQIQTVSETDFDGNPLEPDVVSVVNIEIFNSDFSTRVVSDVMGYDTELGHWIYVWDTASIAAGSYKAMVTFVFADHSISLEGPIRIRLKADPRP